MPSRPPEQFCTLFDSHFLAFGITLLRSLEAHAGNFRLWALCMDKKVEADLRRLSFPNLEIIPLEEVEALFPDLAAIKTGRSAGEYCWTLTPFLFSAVFKRCPEAARVTYLDADLFFFDNPAMLLSELEESGKTVLITDHAYDPEYDMSAKSGRFCVQFNTFGRDPASQAINRWWQERCLEWCFNRHEDGKFGDQKYLDNWPETFGDTVHVLRKTQATLAPWNVRFFHRRIGDGLKPVLFHFHGFRPVSNDRARLYTGYKVGAFGNRIYDAYLIEFAKTWKQLLSWGIDPPTFPTVRYPFEPAREFVRMHIRRNRRYGSLA